MRFLFVCLFGVSLLLGGCQSIPVGSANGISLVESGQLPAATPANSAVSLPAYHIGPFDEISIDVFGVEALSFEKIQVDAGGNISFPLIGQVVVGGKTPREVAADIEGRLRGEFVRNPQVSINLLETVSQVITVDGAVREPGLYPVVGQMTLIKAVATAKGTTETASTDDVVVFRTVDGQRYVALYNLGAIRRGAYVDPELFASDVVVVGNSRGRQLFQDLFAVLPAITGPLVLALSGN